MQMVVILFAVVFDVDYFIVSFSECVVVRDLRVGRAVCPRHGCLIFFVVEAIGDHCAKDGKQREGEPREKRGREGAKSKERNTHKVN